MRYFSHSVFIAIGSILWLCSFFGEIILLQPYSTYGIWTSPIIFVLGIVQWFHYRKASSNPISFKDVFSAPFQLNGFIKVWIVVIFWWMLLFFGIAFGFGNTESITAAKDYCRRSNEVIARAGKIRSFGLLPSGEQTRETGHYSIVIVGEKENFRVKLNLVRQSSGWEVVSATLD